MADIESRPRLALGRENLQVKEKLIWAGIYGLVFLLSFCGGLVVAARPFADFAGIAEVDWTDAIGAIETDLPYGDGALNKFDLYLPTERARATKLVLYIHAGGFTGGDKADDAKFAKYFASKGYVGATINYSLRSDANDYNVKQMSDEIKQGVAAIVTAAKERGYPLNGMAIAGGSAGATLAMIYAYRDAKTSPVPVNAVISMVGPASFEPAAWFGFKDDYASDETAKAGAQFVTIMTGDKVTPEMMRAGSYRKNLEPITAAALFSPDAPPTLVAYGELDKVAPFAASSDFVDELKRSKVPHDALVFPNSGHALNRDPELAVQLGQKINEYLDRYVPLG